MVTKQQNHLQPINWLLTDPTNVNSWFISDAAEGDPSWSAPLFAPSVVAKTLKVCRSLKDFVSSSLDVCRFNAVMLSCKIHMTHFCGSHVHLEASSLSYLSITSLREVWRKSE